MRELAIQNSLEWPKVHARLMGEIKALNYNSDLRRMMRGVEGMVAELSRLEVEARRTKNTARAQAQLDKVNEAIWEIDGWIVLAALHQ